MDEDSNRTATRRDAEALLQRLLRTGWLQGFPTHPRQLDTVLAIATSGLARQRPYAEWEINESLRDWLTSVRARIDHVTLRRRMVDCGFLKRTRDGARYFLNYGRVVGVLGDPAVEVDAGAILDAIVREREARKAAYARSACGPPTQPSSRSSLSLSVFDSHHDRT